MKNKGLLKISGYCFIWIVIFFAVQFLVSLPFALIYGQNVNEKMMLIAFISAIIFLAFVLISFAVTKKKPLTELDWNSFTLKTGIFSFLAALFFSLGYNICINIFASGELRQSITQQTEYTYASGMFMVILCAVLLQPLTEEVLFRALIMKRLSQSMPIRLAIVISAFLFSVTHIMAGLHLLPMTFIGGLIFAYTYHKSGSLIPAVLAHMGANIGGLIFDLRNFLQ